MEKVFPVLGSTGSVPTLLPLALEQHPGASLVQKDPESLQSPWDLFIEIFKIMSVLLGFLGIQRSYLMKLINKT